MLNTDDYHKLSEYRKKDISNGYDEQLKACFNEACEGILGKIDLESIGLQKCHPIINFQPEESDERLTYTTEEAKNNSRACFLFKQYQVDTNKRNREVENYTPFYIHDHFQDAPTLVCVSIEGNKNSINIKYYKEGEEDPELDAGENLNANDEGIKDYKKFLSVMFGGDNESWKIPDDKDIAPSAFICFNLSIPHFSYMGSLMFEIINLKEGVKIEGVISDIKEKLVQIREVLMVVKRIEHQYINDKYLRKIKSESIKSAKAAIISRNMSHNLGSHVMAYLKQHLGSVKDMLDKKVLYSLVPKIFDKEVDINKIAEATEMPFLVGLGRFIGYLQERQDYIATLATDYIPYVAPVNLKDAIYDELNPDLRYARHHDTDDKNRPSNILLKYIAKSEGLSREEYDYSYETNNHDIRIGFKGYKGEDSLEITYGKDSNDPSMDVLRQINFGVPGGLIGRQAIFSIIENIIRNAAKHGVFDIQTKSLELIIDVIDGLDIQEKEYAYFKAKDRIYNEEIFNLFKRSTDIKNLQIITITDNLKTSSNVIDNLRRALNEDYLDEKGKMQNANKGLKEMRISAAWLRHDTDEESYSRMSFTDKRKKYEAVYGLKAPLFACEMTNDGNLRYLFCVSKCRKAIIVKDNFTNDNIYEVLEKQVTSKNDWKICSKDELIKNDFDKSAEFILVGDEGVYREIRPLLSNRVVKFWTITSDQKEMILKSSECKKEETLLRVIYQLYSGITSAESQICIFDSSPGYESHFKEGIKIWDNEINAESAVYVYRKHHATENDFKQYWNKRLRGESFTAAQCIEGITGNNSSDRLVRRESLDEKWYYLHLNAMKTRVAIFDERIFDNEHKVDDKQFFVGDESVLKFMEENRDFLQSCSLDEATSKVVNELSGILTPYCLAEISVAYTNEELITLIDNHAYKESSQSVNNYRSIYQHQRGVDIFTILKTRDGWGIYGCFEYGKNEDCLCEYGKIAEILLDGDNFKISPCGEGDIKHKYEYISIHQGLLDKLYEGFDCKNDNLRKLKLTSCIYGFFGSDSQIGEYLPNFIIHSGRSKPTEHDMPQKQPFVQYAAIENGVKDCKYSLVELLDYARYE